MLQGAQKLVRAAEFVKFLSADMAIVMQFLQRKERAAGSQPRLRTAIDALQTLDKKFNVADAATVDLHVHPKFVLAIKESPLLLHLLARDQSSFDRGEIGGFLINIGTHRMNEPAG